jgi:hypothetical protein
MLLSIDPEKIREQLATPPAYTVTVGNLEIQTVKYEPVSAHVYSTATGLPIDMENARRRLVLLRQRLIATGVNPLPEAELERTIDETRGRS